LGVADKTGDIIGLSTDEIRQYSSQVGNISTDQINPPINITTEVVSVENGETKRVLIIHIPEGINKPYKNNDGIIYVKQASDKRKLTDNAEILRLFQKSGNLLADEMEVFDTSIDDINRKVFEEYFISEFKISFEEKGLTYEQALKAKKILRNERVTIAGLFFFANDPQSFKPAYTVKAVSFFGNAISGNQYRSKPEDFRGTLPEIFKRGMVFLKSNLKETQKEEEFNTRGKLEISEIALTELFQNALIHRDYLKNSPIRLFVFDDRVEIISPGSLPNSLTIEEIKYGNPVIRNNQIAAFGSHTMPYSGLGSGITRALENQPNIDLINDVEGEQFKVIIPREK